MTLDALLVEVEAVHRNATLVCQPGESDHDFWHRVHAAESESVSLAPILARMLRVAVGALRVAVDDLDPECPSFARAARNRVFAAISRLDAMAGEGQIVGSRTHEGWKRKIHHDAMRKARKCHRCLPHRGENRTQAQAREQRHRKKDRRITARRRRKDSA